MNGSTTSKSEAQPQTLNWRLVNTEPQQLVNTAPEVKPMHPLVRRAVSRAGGWTPSEAPAGPEGPSRHSALNYAIYIGRVGLLAAALGVGAALGSIPRIARAETTDTDSSASASASASATTAPDSTDASMSASGEPAAESQNTATASGDEADSSPVMTSGSEGIDDEADTIGETIGTSETAATETVSIQSAESEPATESESLDTAVAASSDAVAPAEGTAQRPTGSQPAARPTPPPIATPAAAKVDNTRTATVNLAEPGSTTTDNTVTDTVKVGWAPTQMTVNPDGTRAYVTNTNGNSVSVIDTATNTVTATVSVGWKPTAVAISPDGIAYVTNAYGRSVSVIDTATNTVTATVRVGWKPTAVAISPDGNRAYIANAYSNSVSVIDTATNTVIRTVRVGWTPTRIAVDPDGNRAYVTNTNSNSVSVIDTATNTVIDTIGVGWKPTAVTISPDGIAYVTNAYSNSVSVIDTATNTVIDTIGVGWKPTAVTISPDGLVYVTNTYSRSVSVIDTATNTVVDTVGVGNGPVAVAVGSAGSGSGPVYTPPSPPGTPDPTTGAVTGALGWVDPDGDPLTITLTSAPAYGTVTFDDIAGTYDYVPNQAGRIRAGLGLTTEDSFTVDITQPGTTTRPVIYVANVNSNTVSVIAANADQPAPAALTRVEPSRQAGILGQAATKAAATPVALAGDGFSQQVTINGIQITPDQFVVGDPITVPGHPYGVAFSPGGTLAYVVNSYDVSVIDTANNTVIGGPIGVGVQPTRVAFSRDGKRAYVTNSGSDTVSVINTDPGSGDDYNTVVATIDDLPSGSGPIALAVSSDGSRVYVANYASSTVSVIDADTYDVIGDAIPVGPGPQGVAVHPDGTHVYVTSTGGGSGGPITIIDTTTATPPTQIQVGLGSFGVAFSPDGNRLYAISGNSFDDPFVAVIDTAPPGSPVHNPDTYNKWIDSIGFDGRPFALELAVSPDGSLIYVTHSFAGTMSVIDVASHEVLTTMDVVSTPLVVAVHPGGYLIYVANGNQQERTVSVISIVPAGAT